MNTILRPFLFSLLSMWAALPLSIADEPSSESVKSGIAGALIEASDASATRLKELASSGVNTVVFPLTSSSERAKDAIHVATAKVRQAGLSIAYWVEVARSPEIADEHPDWMASLQTHDEWQRFFPEAAKPRADEVAKTYPWVPILSRAPFEAQRKRVLALLAGIPPPQMIFLNDLQGAPSACGCGNTLCRWTSDYGERRTTIPLGDDAAAMFVTHVQSASPHSEVIPVWTTECEEHDGRHDGQCAGVGCFKGICWKAYTRQLMPVARTSERIAVLAPYKEFQRDIPHYGSAKASWIGFAIKTFQTMPPLHDGEAISTSRVIAVVQGWDVSDEEVAAQRTAVRNAGANGYVIAYSKIDQSWSPKVVPWR